MQGVGVEEVVSEAAVAPAWTPNLTPTPALPKGGGLVSLVGWIGRMGRISRISHICRGCAHIKLLPLGRAGVGVVYADIVRRDVGEKQYEHGKA